MTYLNKSSQYVSSLVNFILDTKPYHSKLTEIVEEYQFFDEMHVQFQERTFARSMINPTWLYNFFSSGDPQFNTMPLKQLNYALAKVFASNYLAPYGAEKAFRDENTDLANIPFVFSKKGFDGPGVADVLVERNGNRDTTEALVEGIDYFQSHGSFQFQVKQTTDANTNFVPSWADARDANLISTASANTRRLANDNTKPESALNQILALLLEIQLLPISPTAQIILVPMIATLQAPQDYATLRASAISDGISTAAAYNGYDLILHLQERYAQLSPGTISLMNGLLAILDSFILTSDYEPLLNQLIADATVPMAPYVGWVGNDGEPNLGPAPPRSLYVDERLSALTPSMYFNLFSDTSVRESGEAAYESVSSPWLNITLISVATNDVAGDTWHVICQDDAYPLWSVFSNINGYVGSFVAGVDTIFTSSTISFTANHVSQCPTVGQTLDIANRNQVVFGPTAPLETWDIIKVNPLAYTRPVLLSTRHGYIQNLSSQLGLVTLVFPNANLLETGTIVLTARADGVTFDISSIANPWYTGVATVGTLYNDGYLGFTIVAGSLHPFELNDRFYIQIVNDPAEIVDLDLGYGYDLESYDNPDLDYDISQPPGTKINFVFGTRFTDYNLSQLNLQLAQNAVAGRSWRLRAIPNIARPIATLKKDGSISNAIDLQASTSGIAPDPALNAPAVFETIGQATNAVPDLLLYYADSFELEWSTDGFNTVNSEGIVPVDTPYSNPSLGLSFTLQSGSKPFIAVVADDYPDVTTVQGGDIISFSVQNNDVYLSSPPIGISSSNVARLIMHGDGFHEAPPAVWTVAFSSPTQYTVSGILTEGSIGNQVPGGPVSGTLTTGGAIGTEGHSFNALGVHFTIVEGAIGLAAGDSFTFRTFSRKPSYLVHGSVSGWQPEAVVGEAYWNGIIGFEITPPVAELYNLALTEKKLAKTSTNTWALGAGTLSLSRLRFDAPELSYQLTPTPIGSGSPTGWIVHRADVGHVGHLSRTAGSFTDSYVTIEAAAVPSASTVQLQLVVTPDDFTLWNAQDTVIIRSPIVEKFPTANDFVLVDKRTNDSLGLNLNYDTLAVKPNLAPLAPFTINVSAGAPVIIDSYTGPSGIPLSNTSPETAILRDWIPITITPYDSSTSRAEFSDPNVSHVIRASGSGQEVGRVLMSGTDRNWPVHLEWDLTFYSTYLPLNAEANLVTYGSGFNDIVRARISESVKFLVSGGVLTTDYLFTDDVNVAIDEYNTWSILQTQADSISAVVSDGPFGGFLAGYDNTPYDLSPGENINGDGFSVFNAYPNGYDAGLPLTSHYHEARQLAGLDPLTPFQAAQTVQARAARLAVVLGLIDAYLVNHDLSITSLDQFLANMNVGMTGDILGTSGFGIPAVGMAMDIAIGTAGANANNPGTEGASTSIQDAMVIMVVDQEIAFDSIGFDNGGLDAQSDRTALIYSGSLPPVPSPLPPFTTYDAFETPLAIVGDPSSTADFTARIFEISFRVTAVNLAFIQTMPNPQVFIWLPAWPAPQQMSVVEKVGTGKYRVSIPQATEAKLYLQPGP